MNWERIMYEDDGDEGISVNRAAVPGGWIYKIETWNYAYNRSIDSRSMSTCFVPEVKT